MGSKTQRYDAIEGQLKALWLAGHVRQAGDRAIRDYGSEVMGVLVARCKNRSIADEAFSQGQADFWQVWQRFRWECTVRTLMYKVFMNAVNRWHRDRHHRAQLRVGLSTAGDLVDPTTRDATPPYRKTSVKSRLRALRDQLSDDERTLLILRVDKGFGWREVAQIMQQGGTHVEIDWKREADRRAQQYRRLKEKLRQQLMTGVE